jgi:8-oxo-dGTP diphosphatase
MKNFPVKYEGKEYWISRAIAVVVKFSASDRKGNNYVLAVQRGKGTPDPEFVGSWCLPCGYLDFDETTKEAAARELKEETGIEVSPEFLNLVSINDNPEEDKRQNVTFRYTYDSYKYKESLEEEITDKYSELEEVSNIKFIPEDKIDNYMWAFNHDKIIKDLYY